MNRVIAITGWIELDNWTCPTQFCHRTFIGLMQKLEDNTTQNEPKHTMAKEKLKRTEMDSTPLLRAGDAPASGLEKTSF